MNKKIDNKKTEKKAKSVFSKSFPLSGSHPTILFGWPGGGFDAGGGGFYDGDWNSGSGGPSWDDNIPPDTSYSGDDWGNYDGYGSPVNPIQLDEVTITPAQVNSPSAWSALGWTVLGIIEAVVGVGAAAESGGLGVYLIIDGIGRTGLNLVNFVNAIKDNNVPTMPGNFGGAIGMGFSGEEGALWGSIANDVITALVSGGVYGNAEDAAIALKNSHYLEAVASGAAATGDANTIQEWFEEWKEENDPN